MKKTLNVCVMLLMLSALLFSCKKKDNEFKKSDELTGSWYETSRQTYIRRLNFQPGGKFAMDILGTDSKVQTTLNGRYVINGNTLSVTSFEIVETQPSGKVVTTKMEDKLFDKATFNIKNLVLTIDYVSYPADAPVPTQATFNKILAID
jgi:hypothetical protein